MIVGSDICLTHPNPRSTIKCVDRRLSATGCKHVRPVRRKDSSVEPIEVATAPNLNPCAANQIEHLWGWIRITPGSHSEPSSIIGQRHERRGRISWPCDLITDRCPGIADNVVHLRRVLAANSNTSTTGRHRDRATNLVPRLITRNTIADGRPQNRPLSVNSVDRRERNQQSQTQQNRRDHGGGSSTAGTNTDSRTYWSSHEAAPSRWTHHPNPLWGTRGT